MFNFSLMIDQATELFHSANIGELMNDEAPADLQDALDQAESLLNRCKASPPRRLCRCFRRTASTSVRSVTAKH